MLQSRYTVAVVGASMLVAAAVVVGRSFGDRPATALLAVCVLAAGIAVVRRRLTGAPAIPVSEPTPEDPPSGGEKL